MQLTFLLFIIITVISSDMPGPPRGPSNVGHGVDSTGRTIVHQSSSTDNAASNEGITTGPSRGHSAGSAAGRTVVNQSTSSAPSGVTSPADHNQYQRFQENDSFSYSVNNELDCTDFLVNSEILTKNSHDIERWKEAARRRPRRVGQGNGFDSWKPALEYVRANETEKLVMPKFNKAKMIMGDSYVSDPATSEEHHAAQLYANQMWTLFHASGKVPKNEAAQMSEVHNVILDKSMKRRRYMEVDSNTMECCCVDTLLHNGVSLAPDAVQEFAQIESMCINGMCKGDENAVTYLTNVARINPKATVAPEKTGQFTQDGSRQPGATSVLHNRDRYDDLQVTDRRMHREHHSGPVKRWGRITGSSSASVAGGKGTSLIIHSVRTAFHYRGQHIHGNKDVTSFEEAFESNSQVKSEYDDNSTTTA